ncbi:alpha/beta-hydrolase [Phialemonium atrogriseum]|uniref:Alpha/beta-hydrolase n=1 Tax=Phialemonium atrogriseum TaxID=1093897 RepID=A0AAJ0BSL9_9PEZI|nr:alpha/beta-hydrolase [Phialemonium atrogriseum]KAK1763540.1 alpha/beta-hydrolase [Phialemonium atrogriseum]
MISWTLSLRPNSAIGSCAIAGTVVLSVGLILRPLLAHGSRKKPWISSPRRNVQPHVSAEEIESHPYHPGVLPGARDVQTPYGAIHVFEWGPEEGEKVLLMHGIGTPCVALADLAGRLVENGYRVMVFDLFGRGYSDAPVDVPYDIRLYTTQVLLVLASSSLAWTGDNGFHLVGYSLGGGLAVSFTQYFAHMVRSLTLIAGGGLIRRDHVGWESKLLYSAGLFPEWALECLVRRRISPKQAVTEVNLAIEVAQTKPTARQRNSDANGGSSFDSALLSKRRPGHTVASVMAWQLGHHRGFIPAFMSTIRHAPIYEQRRDWAALGKLLSARRARAGGLLPGLQGGKVLLVLGASDTVIIKEELVHDAAEVLGTDGFEVAELDCGHEIAIAKGEEVADEAIRFWQKQAEKVELGGKWSEIRPGE